MTLEKIGLHVPEILLPNKETDMHTWSVVACDQYTSQPEYWEAVAGLVGDKPSTLRLILPEVYLDAGDEEERVAHVNGAMQEYVDKGILKSQGPGFVLVDRKTSQTESRKGLIAALDLEHYDYSKGSETLIRATEGTIVSRLAPRMRIRKNASLELPHILVLIDDPQKTVIEPLFEKELEKLYDFELMQNSGHITGYAVTDANTIQEIGENISKLADPELFSKKYDVTDKGVLLYAMGDGNHSFATAKALWEKIKEDTQDKNAIMDHPARYALVELVNIHDDGLIFEPIHRVIFNINVNDIMAEMERHFKNAGSEFSITGSETDSSVSGGHTIPFVTAEGQKTIIIQKPALHLEVENLQSFLDGYLEKHPDATIDYIHGSEAVTSLASKPDTIGFFLPPLSKDKIFKTIINSGSLPRKAFSLGEADEKRFYLEARKIRAVDS